MAEQLWKGRFSKAVDSRVNDFNSSIRFDQRMIAQDMRGSGVHAAMLAKQGIISEKDCEDILNGLASIADDLAAGKLEIDPGAEDVHTFVEQTLTARIGDAGKRLHTGRSRNDQVALDIRLTLRDYSHTLQAYIVELIKVICKKAGENTTAVMPGYTHLQRAQPITFGHALMAYAFSAAEAVNPGHTKIGRVASGDQFIADKEKKDFIIEKTQALCTEMEGAAIAQTAYRNGVPFVILRAISDKADNSAEMDYPTFETLSAHRCAEVTHRLARQLMEAESASVASAGVRLSPAEFSTMSSCPVRLETRAM